jgi:hypothetical protein
MSEVTNVGVLAGESVLLNPVEQFGEGVETFIMIFRAHLMFLMVVLVVFGIFFVIFVVVATQGVGS